MFMAAFHGRGLVLNLNEVPDEILPQLMDWLKEQNDKLKAEYDKHR